MASHRKTHLSGAAEPGAQFVQLEVRDMQVAEGMLMEELSVLACASEPLDDGHLPIAEDAFSRGRIQPFSQGGEHHGDLVRGGFQTVQRGVASSTERGAALLAAKGLDLLSLTMLAIAKKPRGSAHRCYRSTRTADWDRQNPGYRCVWALPDDF